MSKGTDLALKVTVPKYWSEVVGAMLMERLGPYAEEASGLTQSTGGEAVTDKVALVFYPREGDLLSDSALMEVLPERVVASGEVSVSREEVSRDWVNGWKDHFHPVTIGRVRVRPPWEPPAADGALLDVVINPGLGFGTGLHPTTKGTLTLLQAGPALEPSGGALVDAGTGSGILCVAAAKLGWGPIIAFDNDPVALTSARENVVANGVAGLVEIHELGAEEAPLQWFAGVTVLANMTLTPVLALLRRVAAMRPARVIVSGILAGAQEDEVLRVAAAGGLALGQSLYEAEWASLELVPSDGAAEV